MDRYIYIAVFDYDEDGYTVTFPDLPGCITCGDDMEEAYMMAKEALELHLYGMEEDGDEIPVPSKPIDIKLDDKNKFTALIEAYMPLVRDQMANKSVKKTLTIPKWLNDLAEKHNINFSQTLQSALKQYLGFNDYADIDKK